MHPSPSMNPQAIRGSQEFYSVTCPECDGRMFVDDTLCPKCGGDGRLLIPETKVTSVLISARTLRRALIAAAVVIVIAVVLASI